MELVKITTDDSTKYGYFTVKEFHPNASSRIGDDNVGTFYIPLVLIDVGNLFREGIQAPVYVNSSIRTPAKNKAVGGVKNSYHLPYEENGKTLARAIDFGISKNITDIHQALLNNGPLAKELRSMGIGGIGLYDTFIHVDTGEPRMWDNRVSTKNGKYNPVNVFENIGKILKKKDPEEAADIPEDMAGGFIKNPLFVIVIVLALVYYFKK